MHTSFVQVVNKYLLFIIFLKLKKSLQYLVNKCPLLITYLKTKKMCLNFPLLKIFEQIFSSIENVTHEIYYK